MNNRSMRSRKSKATHAVPADEPQQISLCGLDADGWTISDCAPDCRRCLRLMAKEKR